MHARDFHGQVQADGELLRREPGVSAEDSGALRARAKHVHARGRAEGPAKPVYGGGQEGGGDGDVRGYR